MNKNSLHAEAPFSVLGVVELLEMSRQFGCQHGERDGREKRMGKKK
jgi:hypothetical protein